MIKKNVTVVVPVIGDYLQVQPPLADLVSKLSEVFAIDTVRLEVIFVADGAHWNQTVDSSSLPAGKAGVFLTEKAQSMPACLLNRGVSQARGEFLAFLWPGTSVAMWSLGIKQLASKLGEEDAAVAGKLAHRGSGPYQVESWLWNCEGFEPDAYPSGWIELADIVPMECCLVRRSVFKEIGGFSTSPILQRGFWWDFSLRLSRHYGVRATDVASPPSRWSWHSYPLTSDVGISGDLMARRVMRGDEVSSPACESTTVDWTDVERFASSMAETSVTRLNSQLRRFASVAGLEEVHLPSPEARTAAVPLRVTVLGGPNESSHNQLCFFNYFKLLERDNLITWRTCLDTAATASDMLNSDLVIFSRTKTKASCGLIDFCKANQIPTIYMLDDNWFSVATEWKEYEALFSPGAPMYENFTHCLKQADICLTYNAVLAGDLNPYTSEVTLLPTNIDLSLFRRRPKGNRKTKLIGYVGSARQDTSAFSAMRDIAMERDDVTLLVMSSSVPGDLAKLPKEKLQYEPYVFSYKRYADIVCRHAPDILIAPLGNTRTEASKCPNKYLEISAVGAAGVFSDVEPYASHIANGRTGLLVQENANSWKKAIEQLLDDDEYRQSIAANALRDVTDNFSTDRVIGKFWSLLTTVAAPSLGGSGR